MDNKQSIILILVLLVGIGIGYVVPPQYGYYGGSYRNMGIHMMSDGRMMSNGSMMYDSMGSMMTGLYGKTGDAFDQAFLSEMIIHHEGAVEMAEAALVNAKHQEIKNMANAIISAQTLEINQMKAWQKNWYNQ